MPARAPAPKPRLASPPPRKAALPLPSPHTLAHALWTPYAHVLNPRRPSCRLQSPPGLPLFLLAQSPFVGRQNNVSPPFTTLTCPNICRCH